MQRRTIRQADRFTANALPLIREAQNAGVSSCLDLTSLATKLHDMALEGPRPMPRPRQLKRRRLEARDYRATLPSMQDTQRPFRNSKSTPELFRPADRRPI